MQQLQLVPFHVNSGKSSFLRFDNERRADHCGSDLVSSAGLKGVQVISFDNGFYDVQLDDSPPTAKSRRHIPDESTNEDYGSDSLSTAAADTTKSLDDQEGGQGFNDCAAASNPSHRPITPVEPQTFGLGEPVLLACASQWRSSNTSVPIQLTGWRLREDDRPPSPLEASVILNSSMHNSDENSNRDGSGYQRLAPEDLPRLYPEWTLGIPFIFDEQAEEETKGCCGNGRLTQSAFVRWFIAVISFIGLACVVVGVVIGALTISGSTRLTLCLLMIGVGVVLITVSGLAWRLTAFETPDCTPRASCLPTRGMASSLQRHPNGTGVILAERPHSRISYSRVCRRRPVSHQYFTDVFQNPEFVWRPPPPSYRTAMRDRSSRISQRREANLPPPTGSPPPTYRSCSNEGDRPSVIAQLFRVASRPPSYSACDDPQNIPMSVFPQSISTLPIGRASTPIATGLEGFDPVRHDDRASLVLNEAIAVPEPQWAANATECSTMGSTASASDRLTIIDCSEPVPIGFELRRSHRATHFWGRSGYQRRIASGYSEHDSPAIDMHRYV